MKKILLLCVFATMSFSQPLVQQTELILKLDENISQIENVLVDKNSIQLKKINERGEFISSFIQVPLKDVEPFLAFAIRLKSNSNNFKLFFQSNKSAEWQEMEFDSDSDDNDGIKTSVIYFLSKETHKIRFKIIVHDNIRFDQLSLWFISPGSTPQSMINEINEITKQPIGTEEDFPKPNVVSRTAWGCPTGQSSPGWTPSYTTVTHLIVHHSAGSNSSSDWAAVVRSIWSLHTNTNGWGDIGYNYLIDPNGVIYEGRAGGDNVVGAHFCGTNGYTMGTCVMGTYTSVLPAQNALTSLKNLFTWKANQRGINPLGISYHSGSGLTINNVNGHRSGCATECPGTTLFNYLPQLRNEMFNLLAVNPPQVSSNINNNTTNFRAYKSVILNFSSAMDTASVRSAFSIIPYDTLKLKWNSLYELEIQPIGFWEFSTTYNLKIDSSAKNVFGIKLDGNGDGTPGDPFNLIFTTTPPDNSPPVVIKNYPVGNSVNIYSEMKIVFDEPVDGLSGKVFIYDENNNAVVYTSAKNEIKNDKGVVTFRPAQPLLENKPYTVKFSAGIKDKFGNTTTSDIILPFATQSFPQQMNIIDQFETIGGWKTPQQSTGQINIDSTLTTFSISGERKRSGNFSGKLTYQFKDNANGRVKIDNNSFPNSFSDATQLGIWIWGDLNENRIELWFNSSQNIIDLGIINWYGWEYKSISLDNIPIPKSLNSIVLNLNNTDEIDGFIYVDDLQHNGTVKIKSENYSVNNFYLEQNYPNPFNPITKIKFFVPDVETFHGISLRVILKIYDILGNEVAALVNEELTPGEYEIEFSANNNSISLSSGIYFYQLQAGEFVETKKMILMR